MATERVRYAPLRLNPSRLGGGAIEGARVAPSFISNRQGEELAQSLAAFGKTKVSYDLQKEREQAIADAYQGKDRKKAEMTLQAWRAYQTVRTSAKSAEVFHSFQLYQEEHADEFEHMSPDERVKAFRRYAEKAAEGLNLDDPAVVSSWENHLENYSKALLQQETASAVAKLREQKLSDAQKAVASLTAVHQLGGDSLKDLREQLKRLLPDEAVDSVMVSAAASVSVANKDPEMLSGLLNDEQVLSDPKLKEVLVKARDSAQRAYDSDLINEWKQRIAEDPEQALIALGDNPEEFQKASPWLYASLKETARKANDTRLREARVKEQQESDFIYGSYKLDIAVGKPVAEAEILAANMTPHQKSILIDELRRREHAGDKRLQHLEEAKDMVGRSLKDGFSLRAVEGGKKYVNRWFESVLESAGAKKGQPLPDEAMQVGYILARRTGILPDAVKDEVAGRLYAESPEARKEGLMMAAQLLEVAPLAAVDSFDKDVLSAAALAYHGRVDLASQHLIEAETPLGKEAAEQVRKNVNSWFATKFWVAGSAAHSESEAVRQHLSEYLSDKLDVEIAEEDIPEEAIAALKHLTYEYAKNTGKPEAAFEVAKADWLRRYQVTQVTGKPQLTPYAPEALPWVIPKEDRKFLPPDWLSTSFKDLLKEHSLPLPSEDDAEQAEYRLLPDLSLVETGGKARHWLVLKKDKDGIWDMLVDDDGMPVIYSPDPHKYIEASRKAVGDKIEEAKSATERLQQFKSDTLTSTFSGPKL